ncbi:hypothetical protein Nepgr_027365 [Nepenthes gracilis]|uniref:Uncharacterized protein n=1 Tax=Nepenthes gracilis TaxID=150966 RepID=A0AAD3T9X8_NEPGR|nr:hypothetical protein Nepgr_027365 [Nepenthes gracilis]
MRLRLPRAKSRGRFELPDTHFRQSLDLGRAEGGEGTEDRNIQFEKTQGHLKNQINMLNCNRASSVVEDQCKQLGNEEKKAAVESEMKRMHQLPVNSTYASHRLRVLNKILQLMSIQRSGSQDEELELLFAGLSL